MSYVVSVLVGSARPGRQGIKVAQLVVNKLRAKGNFFNLFKGI